LIVAIVGPFMIAGQVRGVDQYLIEMIEEPELVHILLQKCTQTCKEYMNEIEKAGADVISIIDATSSPDLISPKSYDTFSSPYVRDMIKNSKVPKSSYIYVVRRALFSIVWY